jgi:hypothetical protein
MKTRTSTICIVEVAHLFARRGGFPLVDLSAPAMNPLGQLILQLTCLGPAFDLAGAPWFGCAHHRSFCPPRRTKGGKLLTLPLDPFPLCSLDSCRVPLFRFWKDPNSNWLPPLQFSIFTFHTAFGRPLYPKTEKLVPRPVEFCLPLCHATNGEFSMTRATNPVGSRFAPCPPKHCGVAKGGHAANF